MDRSTSPTKSPATPRSNLKSMLTASCTSASGIQITPPSASRTNLLSITRPFPEDATEYTDEETGSGLRRTLSSPIRRARDFISGSDSHTASDTESQDENHRQSHQLSGLRKSPSWSTLFSPSKSSKLGHRKEPEQADVMTTTDEEDEGNTTRRSLGSRKGIDRAHSLKDKALGLIRGGKRGSLSSISREASSPSKDPGQNMSGHPVLADQTRSTTPPGTPRMPDLYAPPAADRSLPRSTPSPPTSTLIEAKIPSPRKSTTPSPRKSTTPSPRRPTTPSSSFLHRRASSSPSAPDPSLSTPKPFGGPSGLGDIALGPNGSLRRGILKLAETPGSGRSVRFGSRNAYRILTPTSPTTSYSSGDQLGPNLFALGRRGRQDNEDGEDVARPIIGLESSVSAVGKGRPPINRMGSSSSSSSTGSGTGKKVDPVAESPSRRMGKKSSIEEKLRELYLVGKKTIESASSASSIDAESEDERGDSQAQWPELGSTLDLPSEGAFEGSEYTDFLLEDRRMEGLLPEQSRVSERTVQAEQVTSSSSSFSKSTPRRTVLDASVAESERTQILLSIREKQQARIREESTVLGLLGDRTEESRRSSETSMSRGSPSYKAHSSPSQQPVSTTPKISPTSRRVSSASRRNVSMSSDKGSFDVLSHYGDEGSPATRQARISSGTSANLAVDSPNLSRWSPDTTGDEPSRSRSASLSNSDVRNSRTEASLMDESDRSVGVMIVHEDQLVNTSGEVYEAFEDGTESMKDGSSMEGADKVSSKSFSLLMPGKMAASKGKTSPGELDRSSDATFEMSLKPATPEKANEADKTMFWTPGSAFQDLSLSELTSPSSNSPVTGESLTRSIVSLGHALIAAEDVFIDQLKAEIQRWKGIAHHLHNKVEVSESKRRSDLQARVTPQSPSPLGDSGLNAKCTQLAADLGKAQDDQREAEIQLEGMQRHYLEAKEREERWQARYELAKNSWEAEKREKEELAVRMRDEEIKREGVSPLEESAVSALKLEMERLQRENAEQAASLKALAEGSRQPREQEKLLRDHAANLEKHLEEQRVEANTRLKALSKDNSTLKKQRDDLHEYRLDLETALDALRSERTSVQQLQKRLTRKQEEMETDLHKSREEHQLAIQQRENELELVRSENTASEEKCQAIVRERDAALRKAEEMSNEMDMIVKQASEIEQQHARLGERMAQVQQEREELFQEKKLLVTERDEARNARDVEAASRSELVKECEEIQQRLRTLEAQLQDQERSMAGIQTSHKEMVVRLESELQHRREEELQYQGYIESLEEQLVQSEKASTQARSEAQVVTEAIHAIEQKLAKAQEGHEQDLHNARERFGVLDREYVGLKEDHLTLMSELDRMHSLLAESDKNATNSTESDASLQARIRSLEENIESLKKNLIGLRQENSVKDTQIERLQRAREQLKDDKEMLNIALDSKQQEVELLRRKYGGSRQSTNIGVEQFGESISATPAASRLAASVRRQTVTRRSSTANMATPVPAQRFLGRGTPSTINATRRFPSVPKSFDAQVDVSHVLNSSVKFNRKASLGLSPTRRSTSATSSKRHEYSNQGAQSRTTEAEYRAMSLVPSLEEAS